MANQKLTPKGPEFTRFMLPLIESLRNLGGSASAAEACEAVLEEMEFSEDELSQTLKNGGSRVKNQIAWARMYLVKTGYLDSSKRGIWALTEKGEQEPLETINPYKEFKRIHDTFERKKGKQKQVCEVVDSVKEETPDYEKPLTEEVAEEGEDLLSLLKTLPPSGFERLCQRLMRESGFTKVVVTGRPNDGGIDGQGILEINPFVSFKVIFQCKRYKNTVGAPTIRDFRGALYGRADKGIMITTGTFTSEAKKEATREGAPQIELVDGDKLVRMFETLELGVKPRIVFDVDYGFFGQFQTE